jgi:SPP1 family predicted phage head-tail adaptor
MIDPGKLRERITVQIASGTTNALGETVLTWGNSTAVWASVEGVTARELLLAGQQQTEISHRVRLRFLTGLSSQHRISWRGRTLEIISILEHENRSIHELICQENTA